jgi:hypothetical protein
MTHDEFIEKVRVPYDTIIHKEGDTYLIVHRLMFHWTLIESHYPDWMTYGQRWCYKTEPLAIAAVEEWRGRNWEGEPIGWHRHPDSGRRREDGNPATEYVEG